MFTFKRFYNTDAPAEAMPSIAASMAKSGVLRQPGEEGPVPSVNTEKKETPTTATAAPAIATDAKPAEQAKPESPSPATATQKEQPQTAAPEKVPSWQEVLKTQQPDIILKELGYGEKLVEFLKDNKDLDPKVLGFVDHWKKNDGNVKDYLRALDTDFAKMSPEDVMKYQLQVQNPELDARQLERLYKLKVTDRYKLDPQNYTEEEVADGQIELAVDVKSIRASLSEQQQGFLFPKPVPKEVAPDNKAQLIQQENEAFKSLVDNHPYTKNIFASKALSFGDGEDKFDFPVDPQELLDLLYNPDKLTDLMVLKEDKNGTVVKTPDVEKQILLMGVARYGKDFLKDYAQHFKSRGGKAAIDPIENAKPAAPGTPAKAEVASTNPAAAAAKRGRLVPGGS